MPTNYCGTSGWGDWPVIAHILSPKLMFETPWIQLSDWLNRLQFLFCCFVLFRSNSFCALCVCTFKVKDIFLFVHRKYKRRWNAIKQPCISLFNLFSTNVVHANTSDDCFFFLDHWIRIYELIVTWHTFFFGNFHL